jgi:hypothetical protein
MIPEALERTVLRLVREGGGRASWHTLATRLPSHDVPLDPDVMTVLKSLQARGLVTRAEIGGGMDAWAITPAGEARLDEASRDDRGPPRGGPLAPDELSRFAGALRDDPATLARALLPYADDGLTLWAILRQTLASDATSAEAVAAAGLFLPRTERAPFARELLDDPRPGVRASLFRAWTPVATDVPGDPLPMVDDAELDEMLRRGLMDPSREVREAAATVAFVAARGAELLGELIVNLEAPEPGLRWWSILALGAASDPLSRELLTGLLGGEDLAVAAAAVRALGTRSDGRDAWRACLDDPRADVRDAAIFALRTVVRDLDDVELAALSADPRPSVQAALIAYRERMKDQDRRDT